MNQEYENGAIRSRVARARVHQASGRRRLLWGLAGLAALAAVGGGGVWTGFHLAREAAPGPGVAETRIPEPGQAEPPAAEPASGPTQSAGRGPERSHEASASEPGRVELPPAEPAPRPGRAAGHPPEPASGPAPPADPAGQAPSGPAQVEEALRRLEDTLKPASTAGSPLSEHRTALERIALGKTKALEAYRDGDADSALRLLAAVQREADDVAREEEARYRLSLRAAKDDYAAGNPEAARMHIAQALERRPGSAEAKAWEARISRLPELLAERRKAEDALGAGKLREERAALRRIVELDPDDAGARGRVRAVERQMRERAFERVIARAGRRSRGSIRSRRNRPPPRRTAGGRGMRTPGSFGRRSRRSNAR